MCESIGIAGGILGNRTSSNLVTTSTLIPENKPLKSISDDCMNIDFNVVWLKPTV